jgi:hypothetical protein
MEEQIKNLSNQELKSLYEFIKKDFHERENSKRKVVINKCYGGFGLSDLAMEEYKNRKNILKEEIYDFELERDDPILIEIVLELKEKANRELSELKVVEIPDGIKYTIEEYDGIEWVAEKHRKWK